MRNLLASPKLPELLVLHEPANDGREAENSMGESDKDWSPPQTTSVGENP